jgi:hypothetical protein
MPAPIYTLFEGRFRQVVDEAVASKRVKFEDLTGMGEMSYDAIYQGACLRVKNQTQLDLVAEFIPGIELMTMEGLFKFEASKHVPILREPIRIRVKTILVQALGPQIYLRQVFERIPGITPDDFRFGTADPMHKKIQQILVFASTSLQETIRENRNRVPNPGGDLPVEFPAETRDAISRKKTAKQARDDAAEQVRKEAERVHLQEQLEREEKRFMMPSGREISTVELEEMTAHGATENDREILKEQLCEYVRSEPDPPPAASRYASLGASFMAYVKRPARVNLGAVFPEGSSEWLAQKTRLDMKARASDKRQKEKDAVEAQFDVKEAIKNVAMAAKVPTPGPTAGASAPGAQPPPQSGQPGQSVYGQCPPEQDQAQHGREAR